MSQKPQGLPLASEIVLPPAPVNMEIPNHAYNKKVECIEMHTSGEPTRILIGDGCPDLEGTLLDQRAQARKEHDHIRTQLMLEPRGHYDMYGAILRRHTELVETGEAHIGVLFLTNEGYSTMCGPTIALGRLLVDNKHSTNFPKLSNIVFDAATNNSKVNLHAPCGLIQITVPTTTDGRFSDPERPVSFISSPSFASGISITVPIHTQFKWPELRDRDSVVVDFAFGGAYYCIVTPQELGFERGLMPEANGDKGDSARAEKSNVLERFKWAAMKLKAAIVSNSTLSKSLFHNPTHHPEDLAFLYSVMIVEPGGETDATAALGPEGHGTRASEKQFAETGLCIFADGQVDRSPTGSAVAARVALDYAKGKLGVGTRVTYHSAVSRAFGVDSAFVGSVHDAVESGAAVRVKVEGRAYYTGRSSFIVEDGDMVGQVGFAFHKLLR